MKIQFIICGWWYDEFDGRKNLTDFIDGLIDLQKEQIYQIITHEVYDTV